MDLLLKLGYTNAVLAHEPLELTSKATNRAIGVISGVITSTNGSFLVTSMLHSQVIPLFTHVHAVDVANVIPKLLSAQLQNIDYSRHMKDLIVNPYVFVPVPVLPTPIQEIFVTNTTSTTLLVAAKSAKIWVVAPVNGTYEFVSM